jgi:hypothetical protein
LAHLRGSLEAGLGAEMITDGGSESLPITIRTKTKQNWCLLVPKNKLTSSY